MNDQWMSNGNASVPLLFSNVSYKFSLLLELWAEIKSPSALKNGLRPIQELTKELTPLLELPPIPRFHAFNDFFFNLFSISQEGSLDLNGALTSKQVTPELLLIFYSEFARDLKLEHKFVQSKDYFLLKFDFSEKSLLVDFEKNGSVLDRDEIIHFVNLNIDFRKLDDGLFNLSKHLRRLKRNWTQRRRFQNLRHLNLIMMKVEPFNLVHIKERARLAYRVGDYISAAEDIRNYFVYKSPEIRSLPIKKIYRRALKKTKASLLKK